jgi:hypothetical protein
MTQLRLVKEPPVFKHAHPQPLLVEEDVELYERVVGAMRQRMGVDKPRPGIHVSELIYCLRKAWALRDIGDNRVNVLGETGDETVFVWIVGHSHEAIFGQGSVRGKSVLKDGIWYTPDFFAEPPDVLDFFDDDGDIKAADFTFGDLTDEEFYQAGKLTEMKSTRASANKRMDDGEMQHYLDQAASYAAAEGRTDAWVWVFHINGDYYHQTTEGKGKGAGPKSILRLWHIKFSKEELERWWSTLLERKEILEGPTMPPAAPKFEWECGYCPVREVINCPGGTEWQLAQSRKRGKKPQEMDNGTAGN